MLSPKRRHRLDDYLLLQLGELQDCGNCTLINLIKNADVETVTVVALFKK